MNEENTMKKDKETELKEKILNELDDQHFKEFGVRLDGTAFLYLKKAFEAGWRVMEQNERFQKIISEDGKMVYDDEGGMYPNEVTDFNRNMTEEERAYYGKEYDGAR